MTEDRREEIEQRLKRSPFRFRWCEASQGCACSGCVNACQSTGFLGEGITPITKDEWQEWAIDRLLLELEIAKEYLQEFVSLKQQKKIPTLQEYRDRLDLIQHTKEYLRLSEID